MKEKMAHIEEVALLKGEIAWRDELLNMARRGESIEDQIPKRSVS